MAKGYCVICNKKLGLFDTGGECYDCITNRMKTEGERAKKVKESELAESERLRKERFKKIIMSTTHTLEGYSIKEYLGVEMAEVIMGTNFLNDFAAGFADFFGTRSTGYEDSLSSAKKDAFEILQYKCEEIGGNAIVGIGVEYISMANNMLGIVINGTVVKIEKIEKIEKND